MDEEWRDVIGYESNYQVSSFGQVRSKPRQKRPGRILKPNEQRYLCVSLSQNNAIRTRTVHSLVAEAFLPNPDNLPEIDHVDRNKHNNVVSNLRWVSKSQNQQNRGMPKHNTSGEQYIQVQYRVCGKKDGVQIQKAFKTLEEAHEYRQQIWGF